ncbi:MAG: L,D-transpeptidase family protein [Candidatus Omnitrophica bacterium]|nr:L,D-transpeptidase family protein [Candidatus Omnitrophota bacterium]
MMKKKVLITLAVILLCLAGIFLIYKAIHSDVSKSIGKIGANNPSSLLHEAETSSARGDDETAIKSLASLASQYPTAPQTELGLFLLGSIYEKKGDFSRAKEAYQRVIEKFPSSNNVARAQEAVENMNIKILFSPAVTDNSVIYKVQKGDSLKKISQKYNTTIEFISKINNLKTSTILVGQELKVPTVKFSIVVDKSQCILTLKADGKPIKTYRVSTGLNNSTPVGAFKIVNKVPNPPWYTAGAVIPAGSPKNILGSRWLGISRRGYGIHGTTDPGSIGKNVTAGCVRMRNTEVEELYTIVPEGTEVVIID